MISQLYATLRATVEATIYLNDDLLSWCVSRLLKIERTSGQFQFFKSLANAKTPNGSTLFSSEWSAFDKSIKRRGPWPLVAACDYIKASSKREHVEFSDRTRVLPEEDALEMIQALVTHHLGLMKAHHGPVFEVIQNVLNSQLHPGVVAAGFRLLLCINQQCKLWRQRQAEPLPVPLDKHTKLWAFLIDKTLQRYIDSLNQPVAVTHALLEALSHIEPDIFDNLGQSRQIWLMSVLPGMCDHPDEMVQTRALHALGDLVLIRGLRKRFRKSDVKFQTKCAIFLNKIQTRYRFPRQCGRCHPEKVPTKTSENFC